MKFIVTEKPSFTDDCPFYETLCNAKCPHNRELDRDEYIKQHGSYLYCEDACPWLKAMYVTFESKIKRVIHYG